MSVPLDLILSEPGRILVLDEVDSTNDEARRRLLRDEYRWPEPPFLVVARRQTAGRGRGSNVWYSDEGSAVETFVLEPSACGLRADHEPRLALAFAACLIGRIERVLGDRLSARLGIRWPNDLEAGGLKWGGLLSERVATRRGPCLLLGVGLNVTTNLGRAPRDVARVATTLDALAGGLGRACWDDVLAQATCHALTQAVDRLARDDATLAAEWAALDTLQGRPVTVVISERVVQGVGAGIDAEGRLRVATATGVEALAGGVVVR